MVSHQRSRTVSPGAALRPVSRSAGVDQSEARDQALAIAAALHLPLDVEQARKLAIYLALLDRWNRVYNLTSLAPGEAWHTHHLADCLAALAQIRLHPLATPGSGQPLRLTDVGSGGGLPAIPFAICEPQWQVTAVDTVDKKASFIRQVAAELGLQHLQSIHARVEALPASHPGLVASQHLITSRAFASLSDFTRLSRSLLRDDGAWVALKGRVPEQEMADLTAEPESVAAVFHVEHLHVPGLNAERCLVWLRPRPIA